MPLYEFHCPECAEDFEELVRSMSAVSQVKCPRCGGQRVEKRVSSFATRASSGGSFSAINSSSCSTGST